MLQFDKAAESRLRTLEMRIAALVGASKEEALKEKAFLEAGLKSPNKAYYAVMHGLEFGFTAEFWEPLWHPETLKDDILRIREEYREASKVSDAFEALMKEHFTQHKTSDFALFYVLVMSVRWTDLAGIMGEFYAYNTRGCGRFTAIWSAIGEKGLSMSRHEKNDVVFDTLVKKGLI